MHAPSESAADAPQLSAGRRGGTKIRPAEFDAEMAKALKTAKPSNQEIARLLGCGESTVSRLRSRRIGLSQPVFDSIAAIIGTAGIDRVCDFEDEAA